MLRDYFIRILFVGLFSLALSIRVNAQVYDKRKLGVGDSVIVVARDSSVYEGLIYSNELDVLYMQLFAGDSISIKRFNIIRINKWTSDSKKRNRMAKYPSRKQIRLYPEYNRYLFTGNYIPLDRHCSYLSYTLFTSFGWRYAATDYVSVGFGAEVFSAVLFNNLTNSVVSMSPKVTIPLNDRWNAGGSLNYVFNLNNYLSEAKGDYGFGLIGVTYGEKAANFSANLGWVTEGGVFVPRPLFNLSGMIRLDNKSALVSENVLIPLSGKAYVPVASLGVRSHVGQRFERKRDVSFGIIFVYAPNFIQGDFPAIPVFDITAAFDKRRERIQF
jgi:hypothetical protein